MEPPIEYPKIYEINFLQRGTILRKIHPVSQDVVNEIAVQLRGIHKQDLTRYLRILDEIYKDFIGSLPIKIGPHGYNEDPKDDFFSYKTFKNDLDYIDQTSREGDLITVIIPSLKYKNDIFKVYYISGFGEDRKIRSLYIEQEEYILPENVEIIIKEYNIVTREDVNKIYPDINIIGYIKGDDYIMFK